MSRPQHQPETIWRTTLLAGMLCALAAFAAIVASPSESGRAVLLGYSAGRLALAAAALLPAFTLGLASLRWGYTWPRLQPALAWLRNSGRALAVTFLLIVSISTALALLPLERAIAIFGAGALYIQQMQPLFGLLAALAAGLLLLWLSARGLVFEAWNAEHSLARRSLGVFVALLGVVTILLVTRLGLGYDATRWAAPNAPILLTQLVLAIAFALLILAAVAWATQHFSKLHPRVDLLLATLVWLLAAVMWLQQPAEATYYSSAPAAPNYESYPLSDAFNHDVIAQNVQIGQGFTFGGMLAVRRPLYVMFLAGLESLFASDYSTVVNAQVLVLALFPAVLYLFAARLHHRLSGLLLAGLIIFRETNAIALGNVINISHAKMLMADLPAALGIALVGSLAVGWLGQPRPNERRALWVGGLLGAFLLLRSQMLTVVPVFVLLAVLVWGLRRGWRSAVLFGLGVLLVSSPWIVRNRLGMGQWAIEDSSAPGFLANRYRYDPGAFMLPFLEGETEGQYYIRQMSAVRSFTQQDPLYVAGFVADNFARNQLVNFMTLPTSPVLRELELHVRQLPYWPSWDGALAQESWVIVSINLALVSIGIAASWQRWRWAGLVPLLINLGFTASLALARVAGWRYNLPADWTVLLYYAIGLGQLVLWLAALWPGSQWLLEAKAAPEPERNNAPSPKAWAGVLAVLLLAGFSYSIIEAASQPRYSKLSAAQALAAAQQVPDAPPQLLELLESGRVDILHGRALYPTFYEAGSGLEGDFVLTQPQDYPRLSFYLIGPEPAPVLLPLTSGEIDFPNASDVIVVRCSSADTDAFAVLLPQTGTLVPSSRMADGCAEAP